MSYILFWILIGAGIAISVGGITAAIVYGPRLVTKVKYNALVAEVTAMREAGIEQVGTRSVDRIDITNIQATGLTTPIDRYTFWLEFWWTENDGTKRHHGPQQYVWPNDLADVPNHIVKEWATELVTQAVRWRLGIDEVPEP